MPTPSLALKLGHSLKKCAKILAGKAIENMDESLEKKARAFHRLCEMNWTDEVSHHAIRTLHDRKRANPRILPLAEDIVTLAKYLKMEGNKHQVTLHKCTNPSGKGTCMEQFE